MIKHEITCEDYKQCLFSAEKQMRAMNIIRSENHDIYSKSINKIALSANDDKRQVCEEQIHTLAFR